MPEIIQIMLRPPLEVASEPTRPPFRVFSPKCKADGYRLSVPGYPFSPVRAMPWIMYFWERMYARSMGPVEITVAAMSIP